MANTRIEIQGAGVKHWFGENFLALYSLANEMASGKYKTGGALILDGLEFTNGVDASGGIKAGKVLFYGVSSLKMQIIEVPAITGDQAGNYISFSETAVNGDYDTGTATSYFTPTYSVVSSVPSGSYIACNDVENPNKLDVSNKKWRSIIDFYLSGIRFIGADEEQNITPLSPIEGLAYIATDTNKLKVGNGSEFRDIYADFQEIVFSISQTGTSSPTISIIRNNSDINLNISAIRSSVGDYEITLTNSNTTNNIFTEYTNILVPQITGSGSLGFNESCAISVNQNKLFLVSRSGNVLADGILSNVVCRVKIYD